MESPESHEPEWEPIEVPHIPLEALWAIEQAETTDSFAALYEQLEDLSRLSTDVVTRRSYHTTFPSEHLRRNVFISAYQHREVGKLWRVVVNDRWTDMAFNEHLRAKDYLVAADEETITKSEDAMIRPRATKTWDKMHQLQAPFLVMATDFSLRLHHSPNYKPLLPESDSESPELLELIDTRMLVSELNQDIEKLNRASMNEGIELSKISETLS